MLSAFLMFVILAVATNTRAVGEAAAIAIGGTVGLNSVFGGPVSAASMNPARSAGPPSSQATVTRSGSTSSRPSSALQSGLSHTNASVANIRLLASQTTCRNLVAEATGRTVIAFMSQVHFDPDMGAEIFVLAPEAADSSPDS